MSARVNFMSPACVAYPDLRSRWKSAEEVATRPPNADEVDLGFGNAQRQRQMFSAGAGARNLAPQSLGIGCQ